MLVVLAGTFGRLAEVRRALHRNLFDLPSAAGDSLLADWHRRLSAFLGEQEIVCRVRLAIDEDAPEPFVTPFASPYRLEYVRDADQNRGTAGVLRDLTYGLAEEDDVLVVQASDLSWRWNAAEGRALLESPADVVLSADRDLRPAGMMRIRCGLLKQVPSVGFVDLKEQFLPRCAKTATIDVVRSERRRAGTLHQLRTYLRTVTRGDDVAIDGVEEAPASAIPWQAGRACVEPGAHVDPRAILFESVVLQGARVGRGALVARSLIGPGVVVADGEQVVDRTLVRDPAGKRAVDVIW